VRESVVELLKRTDDHIEASNERCVAASRSIIQCTAIIALSRDSIIDSREQMARLRSKLT
jgi:hypothetical protein